jgi:hypothetical protein
MLTTPRFPVQGFPDCEACRGFEHTLSIADEPNWTMEFRLPAAHGALAPVGEGYGIPGSGFGQRFRCGVCGIRWDISLLCDHGLERAVVAGGGGDRRIAYHHHGPWTDLVDLTDLPCRLTLTAYSFELETRVAAERVHPDALAILARCSFGENPPPLTVRVEASLQCLRGVGLTDPPDRRVTLRRVVGGAPIQPGRCTERWRRELLDAVLERGRALGITDIEADSFELQTVGVYTLELDRGVDVTILLSELQLTIGGLRYSSTGFLQETDLPESYIVWLYELLMALPPISELERGWRELQRRGRIPNGALPLANVLPAFVEQARQTYRGREFRAWAGLVRHAPGVHLFHDVERGDGQIDGHCRGQVSDALWPRTSHSR